MENEKELVQELKTEAVETDCSQSEIPNESNLPQEENLKDLVTEQFIKQIDKILPKLPFKMGRNKKCFCGSNKKFKYCCITKYQR